MKRFTFENGSYGSKNGITFLHCEKGFRRVKGYGNIAEVIANIEKEEGDQKALETAA